MFDVMKYSPLFPFIFLAVSALFLIIFDLIFENKRILGCMAGCFLIVALMLNISLFYISRPTIIVQNMFVADKITYAFSVIFILGALVVLFFSAQYLEKRNILKGEFFVLIFLFLLGMIAVAGANDLIVVFLGIEILSIAFYILAAFRSNGELSLEAGLKYLILGGLATSFFVFGIALVLGGVGTTNFSQIMELKNNFASVNTTYLTLGLALILIALAFKIAVFPFSAWVADVYQGAPTPVTALMAVLVKSASFAALYRIFIYAFPSQYLGFSNLFLILAILTMTAGNLAAIFTDNIKRMLGYSSIAHAGYLLIANLLLPTNSVEIILFYLLGYLFANLGAFCVLSILEDNEEGGSSFADYQGLAEKNPFLAISLTVFLLSLLGLPLTAGFMGKFYLFKETILQGHIKIVLIALLNSVISAFYYLKLVVSMYMQNEAEARSKKQVSAMAKLALVICLLFILQIGILPSVVIELAK